VKPALTTASEQRPPVSTGWHNSATASINLTIIRAPLSNGLFFQSPRVAVVHRFDCTGKTSKTGITGKSSKTGITGKTGKTGKTYF